VSSPSGRTIVLATSRPAVAHLFEDALRRSVPPILVEQISMGPDRMGSHRGSIAAASAAIVDAGGDPSAALGLCRELRAVREDVPIMALVPSAQPFSLWHLQRLLAIPGGCSVVDLEATADDLVRSVQEQLRGRPCMHLEWPSGAAPLILGDGGERDLTLIGLVSFGLSDQEIGWRLQVSPHTARHRIERLRTQLGVRNRIELAAWAGRNGLYSAAALEPVTRPSSA
jgi:DNA-binding NarL/FixJ family response regulator